MTGRPASSGEPVAGLAAGATEWRVVTETFRWGQAGSLLVAEWPGILTLSATAQGVATKLEPAPGASDDVVEKLRHGAVRAFLRALRHGHSLHASAVSWEGDALVLLGESGAGKSTLADHLCRRGAALLADDVAAIDGHQEGWRVLPSESNLWLSTDESFLKRPSPASTVARHPAALRWLVWVRFEDGLSGVSLQNLRGADAASAVFRSMVRFERSPPLLEREFAVVDELVAQTRVLEMRRARDTSAEIVAEALLRVPSWEAR